MVLLVIPAKAGIQVLNMYLKKRFQDWVPAFAGMTIAMMTIARMTIARMTIFVWMTAITLLFSGCGADSQLKRANKLEKKGKYYEAWQKFQEFAAEHPKHPGAPEALFHAGWLAQKQLKDCDMAAVFYDSVLEKYPQADPWARLSTNQKGNCPDFFPLLPGTEWVEGDSETKGKNARIETSCRPLPEKGTMPSEAGLMVRTYFAGASKFKTIELSYKKAGNELREFTPEYELRPKIIMMLPAVVGTKWKTRSADRLFSYEITAADVTVKVEAGEFPGCIVVRSSVEAVPGATLDYYAPGVGRVLNSFSTAQGEKRNIELLSFKPGPDIDFRADGSNP